MLPINDFIRNIKVGGQSRGFDESTGENLIVNIGSLRRTTNTSSHKYKMKIEPITAAIASRGV